MILFAKAQGISYQPISPRTAWVPSWNSFGCLIIRGPFAVISKSKWKEHERGGRRAQLPNSRRSLHRHGGMLLHASKGWSFLQSSLYFLQSYRTFVSNTCFFSGRARRNKITAAKQWTSSSCKWLSEVVLIMHLGPAPGCKRTWTVDKTLHPMLKHELDFRVLEISKQVCDNVCWIKQIEPWKTPSNETLFTASALWALESSQLKRQILVVCCNSSASKGPWIADFHPTYDGTLNHPDPEWSCPFLDWSKSFLDHLFDKTY